MLLLSVSSLVYLSCNIENFNHGKLVHDIMFYLYSMVSKKIENNFALNGLFHLRIRPLHSFFQRTMVMVFIILNQHNLPRSYSAKSKVLSSPISNPNIQHFQKLGNRNLQEGFLKRPVEDSTYKSSFQENLKFNDFGQKYAIMKGGDIASPSSLDIRGRSTG